MSHDERLQILQMVQDGIITAGEAEALLNALDAVDSAAASGPEAGAEIHAMPASLDIPHPEPTKKKKRTTPDMQRYRRYWEYPFIVGLILVGVTGLCASSVPSPLLAFCGWSVFVVALLIALIGWLSQWSPWMHVRIRERNGRRIVFSVPLPLQLLGITTDIAHVFVRRFADKETVNNVEMAAAFLSALEHEKLDEPIMIAIDEADGDHVELFFG